MTEIKPTWRGRIHLIAAVISTGAGAWLVGHVSVDARWSYLIYVTSLVMLFACSALYHVPQWEPKIRAWLKRLDHSAIFMLIAGTATPLLKHSDCVIMWLAAALGVTQSLFWVKAPKLIVAVLCLALGWLVAPSIYNMGPSLGIVNQLLFLAGGLIYSAGALVYAFKKPNPSPVVFGYHEIFHTLVVIAAALHFTALARSW